MIRRLLFIVFLLLTAASASPQKVGLVLSGGGSKGVAHIGVIRALEEAEIPIDYITGTSMGAIIGGLYAAGYSPDEMEELITSTEFRNWSTGTIDPKYTYYFKAPARTAAWADFKFRVDSAIKPALPTNLVSPMMMDFAFLEVYSDASAAADYDFNKLMVPFKCVASDISKAQPVILESGELGKAIRASMTFPFYFKPIRIDSVLMFDGGLYNNFPSDIMLTEFNPDIIIGSQASSNARAPEVNNVMSQLQNMIMMKSDFNVLCENSVMIKPNVMEVNVIDFSHTEAFIDSGYYMAKRMVPQIREFVTDHRTTKEVDSLRKDFNSKKPDMVIGSIQINGLKPSQYDYMSQLLRRDAYAVSGTNKITGSYLTLDMIKPQYFRFVAEGRVDHIYPELRYYKPNNKYNLTIDIERQNQLTTELGGVITSSSVNELFLQLKYFLWTSQSIHFTANSYFGRFYNSAMVETRFDFPAYKPFYISGGFVYNKFNYFKTNTFFYADEEPFFLIEQERFGYISAGFPYKNNGKLVLDLSFGANRDKYYQTNSYTRDDILDRTSFIFIAPGVIFETYNLNFKEFPNSGAKLRAEAYFVAGSENFYPGSTSDLPEELKIPHTWFKARIEYINFFARYRKLNFGVFGEVNYSSQAYFTNYTSSLLSSPAFQPISESTVKFIPSYRANKYTALGSKNMLTLAKNFDFGLEAYMFMAAGALTKDLYSTGFYDSEKVKFYPVATSMLVYRTPIGPVSANFNYFGGEEKPVSFFFQLGYLIFNRRSF